MAPTDAQRLQSQINKLAGALMLHRWLLHELIRTTPQARSELMKLNPDVEETALMQAGSFHPDTASAFRTELHALVTSLRSDQA